MKKRITAANERTNETELKHAHTKIDRVLCKRTFTCMRCETILTKPNRTNQPTLRERWKENERRGEKERTNKRNEKWNETKEMYRLQRDRDRAAKSQQHRQQQQQQFEKRLFQVTNTFYNSVVCDSVSKRRR